MCVPCECRCLKRPEESFRYPGTGISGNCVPSSVDAGPEPRSSLRAASAQLSSPGMCALNDCSHIRTLKEEDWCPVKHMHRVPK